MQLGGGDDDHDHGPLLFGRVRTTGVRRRAIFFPLVSVGPVRFYYYDNNGAFKPVRVDSPPVPGGGGHCFTFAQRSLFKCRETTPTPPRCTSRICIIISSSARPWTDRFERFKNDYCYVRAFRPPSSTNVSARFLRRNRSEKHHTLRRAPCDLGRVLGTLHTLRRSGMFAASYGGYVYADPSRVKAENTQPARPPPPHTHTRTGPGDDASDRTGESCCFLPCPADTTEDVHDTCRAFPVTGHCR